MTGLVYPYLLDEEPSIDKYQIIVENDIWTDPLKLIYNDEWVVDEFRKNLLQILAA